jgi:uncharacterized protein YjiS (DUF1127 family)
MFKNDNSIQQFSSFEIELQARIERSLAISACARDVGRTFAQWFCIVSLRTIRLVRRLDAERRQRRAICELQRFDDRTLGDMGVTRSEIELLVRNGRPTHGAAHQYTWREQA